VWAHPGPRVWGSRPLRGNQEAPSQTGGHARCSARETAFVRAPWVGPPNRASPMRGSGIVLGTYGTDTGAEGQPAEQGFAHMEAWVASQHVVSGARACRSWPPKGFAHATVWAAHAGVWVARDSCEGLGTPATVQVAYHSAPCSSTEAGLTSMAPRAATPRLWVLLPPPRHGLFAHRVGAATRSGPCCLTPAGPCCLTHRSPGYRSHGVLWAVSQVGGTGAEPQVAATGRGLPQCYEGVFAWDPGPPTLFDG
jgi:hypothetical protein